jgi:outer membrane protein assembly factor BamB
MSSLWFRRGLAIAACLVFALGCATDPAVDADPTKEEAAAMYGDGKADGIDWCSVLHWYGDGVCDAWCPVADEDCGGSDAIYSLEAPFPEGGSFDLASNSFFVGSLGDGAIRRIDAASGDEQIVFTEPAPGLWWTLGMDIDAVRRRLFVCAMEDRRTFGESGTQTPGYVWILDVDTGERLETYTLSDVAANATCTDVAVAADGTAYVCDRELPNIYAIDPDTGLTLFTTDPALEAGILGAGQNAMVVLPDQSAIISAVFQPSALVHVSLADGTVSPVEIDGDFSDLWPPASGADGMTYVDGSVLVAFTSQLNRVTPDGPDWRTATSVTTDVPSGMTDVIHTPTGDYLLNGQALVFGLSGFPDPFRLVRFEGSL